MTLNLDERIATYIDGSASPISADEAMLHAGTSPDPQPRRRLLVAALATFVLVGLVAVLATTLHDTDSGPVTTPDTTIDTRKQDALDRSMAEFESGFVSYPYVDPVTGDTSTGYIPTAPSPQSLMPYFDQVSKRIPIFADRDVNSQIVGYDYTWIGFVPVDVADSGTYDSRAVRISLYGCDPEDPSCRPTSYPITPDTLAP